MTVRAYGAASRLAYGAAAVVLRLERFRAQRERLGELPAELEAAARRPVIWLHNASVGELLAAVPLARALRQALPGRSLVLSATSLAGRDLARRLPEADGAFLLPLDAPLPVARVLDRLRPELFVFTETELWPNLLAALGARRVPAALVSGRVSPRAFRRYRWVRGLLAESFRNVRLFGMQTEAEAERVLALGAPPERVAVTGSLKLDAEPPFPSLDIRPGGPLWVAGSTHPGEERACLEAFASVRRRVPTLRLLLAPRHLERLPEVERALARSGLSWARRSAIGSTWTGDPAILLLDTLGELAGLYRFGAVAFVGGTLVPVGGHNLVEPARAGVPVLFGPHVENVAAAARALEESGGGRRVTGAGDLSEALFAWLADPPARLAAGCAAARTFPAGENTRTTLRAIERMLAEVRG